MKRRIAASPAVFIAVLVGAGSALAEPPVGAGGSPGAAQAGSRASPETSSAPVPSGLPARVIYRRRACTTRSLDEAAFVRLLGIELAADGVTELITLGPVDPAPPAAGALAVLSLAGACDDSRGITIEIEDAATDKSVRRAIDLGDLPPPARARALSLATAELLRASWVELVLPDVPPPRAPVPSAVRAATVLRVTPKSAPPPPQSALEPRAIVLGAGVDARFFSGSGLGMLGGRLSASIPLSLSGSLSLQLDAGAAHGKATDPIGAVDLWLVSGGAGLAAGAGSPGAWIEAGPRLELGWGHAEGRAASAAIQALEGSALVAIASLAAAGRIRIGGRVWTALELQIGPVLKGFMPTADGHALGAVSGAMGAARLGLALPW